MRSRKLTKIQELFVPYPDEKEAFGGEYCRVETRQQPVKQIENKIEKDTDREVKSGYLQKLFGKHYGRLLVMDGILLCVDSCFQGRTF